MAAYLGYEAPSQASAVEDGDDAAGDAPWGATGMGGIPASQAVRDAATQADAIRAFERQFFGEVKDVDQL